MNNQEKVQMLLIYGRCNRNSRQSAKMYAEQYPGRYHPPHTLFIKIEKLLINHGAFSVKGVRNQQIRQNNINDDVELQVLAYIRLNPRSSVRHVGREVGISFGLVHKILKKHKLHPYKPELVQHLRPTDPERRLNFIAWLLVQIDTQPLFLNQILWTDESKFTNNGVINKQNNRLWSDVNPHWAVDSRHQTVWGTNVWCGLIGGKLLGPYFYEENLNARRYLAFLTNVLPLMLENLPLATRQTLYFQHDGAPAHNAHIVRDHLNRVYEEKWFGTYGPIEWPARSPDITPLDFFLWGHLKTIVYADPPVNLADLKNKIVVACNNLTENQIMSATNRGCLQRFQLCVENHGANFEQFI